MDLAGTEPEKARQTLKRRPCRLEEEEESVASHGQVKGGQARVAVGVGAGVGEVGGAAPGALGT